MRTEPHTPPACRRGRTGEGFVRGDGDFDTVPIGIAKPEGIAHLRVAITFRQYEFNPCLFEAGCQGCEFGIGIKLESQVMKPGALEGAAPIADTGPCVVEES